MSFVNLMRSFVAIFSSCRSFTVTKYSTRSSILSVRKHLASDSLSQYELIDSGDLRKLERFGNVLVERPCPAAKWSRKLPRAWSQSNVLGYIPAIGESVGGCWRGIQHVPVDWQLSWNTFTLHLEISQSSQQIGVFPEHFAHWRWMQDRIQQRVASSPPKDDARPIKILNCFAYTGAGTLAALANTELVEVTHVDSSAHAVRLAKANLKLSGLADRRVRWIVDDCCAFVEKEIRRGSKYDAIILDPPAFGRGLKGSGRRWSLRKDLDQFLAGVAKIISDNPMFVLLTCHDIDFDGYILSKRLGSHVGGKGRHSNVEFGECIINHSWGIPIGIEPMGLVNSRDSILPHQLWCGSYARMTDND